MKNKKYLQKEIVSTVSKVPPNNCFSRPILGDSDLLLYFFESRTKRKTPLKFSFFIIYVAFIIIIVIIVTIVVITIIITIAVIIIIIIIINFLLQ